MKTEAFLSRLEKVRPHGRGRWVALCPAHADRSPSLSIAEGDDGRVLAHCFAGCSVADVVAAVGMTLSDLMPEREIDDARPKRMKFLGSQVMESLALQSLIVATAGADIAAGKALSAEDRKALAKAASAIQEGVRYASIGG